MTDTASNESIGAVIGGMIAWEHAIQNSLTDSHLDEAIDWAKRFRDLYDLVKKYNRDMYVNEILEDFGYERDSIIGKIQHYESMKMGGQS